MNHWTGVVILLTLGLFSTVPTNSCANGRPPTQGAERVKGHVTAFDICDRRKTGWRNPCGKLQIQLEDQSHLVLEHDSGVVTDHGESVWPPTKRHENQVELWNWYMSAMHRLEYGKAVEVLYDEIGPPEGPFNKYIRTISVAEAPARESVITVMPIAESGLRLEGDIVQFGATYRWGERIDVRISRQALLNIPYLQGILSGKPTYDRPVALHGRWRERNGDGFNRFEARHMAPLLEQPFRIVFTSRRDGNSEIYSMDLEGRNQRNLTNHPAEDRTPSFSPDQKSVVFASNRRDGNWDLFTMPSSGSSLPTNLTRSDSEEQWPAWSPKGDAILFLSADQKHRQGVSLVGADGKNTRRIPIGRHANFQASDAELEIRHAQWTFDGEDVLFSFSDRDEYGLGRHYLAAAYSSTWRLHDQNMHYADYPTEFSSGDSYRYRPLAHTFCASAAEQGRQSLMVNHKVILSGDFDVRYPVWVPDGRLVFTVARHFSPQGSADREIYITRQAVDGKTALDLNDSDSVLRLTNNSADDSHPMVVHPSLDPVIGQTQIPLADDSMNVDGGVAREGKDKLADYTQIPVQLDEATCNGGFVQEAFPLQQFTEKGLLAEEGVVDGDTLLVRIDDQVRQVRLINVDTPEIELYSGSKAVGNAIRKVYLTPPCNTRSGATPGMNDALGVELGNQATRYVRQLLTNRKSIWVQRDAVGANADMHDRLLRYVYLQDPCRMEDISLNEHLIAEGYARYLPGQYENGSYFAFPERMYGKRFQEIETQARKLKKGFWRDWAHLGPHSGGLSPDGTCTNFQ